MTSAGRATSIVVGALALLMLMVAPVAADCSRVAPSKGIRDYRGLAFVATVADISRITGYHSYRLVFDVERVFAGHMWPTLVATDVGGDCGMLRPDNMSTGQRVFIAVDELNKYSNATFGDVLMWREAGDGTWRFFGDALWAGDPRGLHYPPEAWTATTLDGILRIAAPRARQLPDTSTAPTPAQPVLALGLAASTAALAAAAFAARRGRNQKESSH